MLKSKIRHAFLELGRRKFFCWMPDKMYVNIAYKLKFGKNINWENPQTYNEKLQWLKVNRREPLDTELCDKYLAKKRIAEWIGEEHIIPTLGVWDKAADIDIDSLPEKFVLKCNHDSGSITVCRDKSTFGIEEKKKRLAGKLKHTGYWYGREWPYKNITPKILAEEYIEDENGGELFDYKFFCFNGKPEFLYVSVGSENFRNIRISFYDLEGNEMPFCRKDHKPISEPLKLPENIAEMVKIAGIIAEKVNDPFVRVDLYSVNDNIYFSEVTYFPCSGMVPFEPPEWDEKLGKMIDLGIEKGIKND